MRERRNGDGSISYQVLFRDGTKQRSKTFATTKAAQGFADRIRVLGVKRALAEESPAVTGLTLDQLAEKYWTFLVGRVRSDRTIADYRRDYDNWISPHLGHLVASTIDETDVQNWIDAIKAMTVAQPDGTSKPRLSPKSIGDRHAVLHGIFKFGSAPTRALIPAGHNPCVGTELPKKVRQMPQGLRPAEWQALYAALTTINADAADLALFLVGSGWRWSEATALDTFGVENDGKNVWVTMYQVARRNAAGQVEIIRDAKSKAGKRRIKLDSDLAALIRRRLRDLPNGARVFTTTSGSQWNYGHFNKRYWSKAVKASGIRHVTPHALRHTAVGYLALSGKVSMAEIQRRIGHESIQTTIDVYGGMIEDVTDEALDFMAAMRNGTPTEVDAAPRALPED